MYIKDIYSTSLLNLKKNLFTLTGSRWKLYYMCIYNSPVLQILQKGWSIIQVLMEKSKKHVTTHHPRTRLIIIVGSSCMVYYVG